MIWSVVSCAAVTVPMNILQNTQATPICSFQLLIQEIYSHFNIIISVLWTNDKNLHIFYFKTVLCNIIVWHQLMLFWVAWREPRLIFFPLTVQTALIITYVRNIKTPPQLNWPALCQSFLLLLWDSHDRYTKCVWKDILFNITYIHHGCCNKLYIQTTVLANCITGLPRSFIHVRTCYPQKSWPPPPQSSE